MNVGAERKRGDSTRNFWRVIKRMDYEEEMGAVWVCEVLGYAL
jgi:hypothetical protein